MVSYGERRAQVWGGWWEEILMEEATPQPAIAQSVTMAPLYRSFSGHQGAHCGSRSSAVPHPVAHCG
jgi:hypothetical protein